MSEGSSVAAPNDDDHHAAHEQDAVNSQLPIFNSQNLVLFGSWSLGFDAFSPSGYRSSSKNSCSPRSPAARRSASACRNSMRRIFPEIVLGNEANSIRRIRL
jgi:hypothetical protein